MSNMFPDNSTALPAMLIIVAVIIATLPIYYTWYGTFNERFFISTFQPAKGVRPSPFLLMFVVLVICSLLFAPKLALIACILVILFFFIMKLSRRNNTLENIPNYFIRVFPIEFLGIFLFLNGIMFLSGNPPLYFQ